MPAKKLIHFIGIGGIGVSAIAKYHLEKGHTVVGSDLVSSEITDDLKKRGAKIFIGKQDAKNLSNKTEVVVYSPAVKSDNPELKKARELKIKTLSYPEVLGILTQNHYTIAVSGTHGKSTTTSMIALLMIKAGLDPTVVVGTKLKEFGNSNFRMGKSKYLVVEACEHEESFLNYWPKIAVVTNIEEDHLDYYKNLKNIIKGFEKFASHVLEGGYLVLNGDDKNVAKLKTQIAKCPHMAKFKVKNFSIEQAEAKKLKKIMKIPGEHNVYDALAALTVARILGVYDRISFSALSEYKGSWRRFEERDLKIGKRSLRVISDYGHHPTALKATLEAARQKYPKEKIWCVFQPHQYQRTYYLFDQFVKAIKESLVEKFVDKMIITDIYDVAGREEKEIKRKVDSKKLVKAIRKNNALFLEKNKLQGFIKKNASSIDVLIIMGAGDIYDFDVCLAKGL